MAAYYNEIDPFAAQWLRNLIKLGVIADGDVDERSILDVQAEDLRGYDQHHFFAGIGTWSWALRQAGWADDRPVWTGSPPCQPFSVAGAKRGVEDERHLAPAWINLVREFQPSVIFGEQVAAAIRHGWLDDLQDELEAEDYSCGATVLPACSVGAPHLRQRLWFVAERMADSSGYGYLASEDRGSTGESEEEGRLFQSERACTLSRMGDTSTQRLEGHSWYGDRDSKQERDSTEQDRPATETGSTGRMANSRHSFDRGGCDLGCTDGEDDCTQGEDEASSQGREGEERIRQVTESSDGSDVNRGHTSKADSFWSDIDWLFCRDGKWRPVEPSTFPLVDGTPERMGRIRGYGNGIVAPLAQTFIEAYMEVVNDY